LSKKSLFAAFFAPSFPAAVFVGAAPVFRAVIVLSEDSTAFAVKCAVLGLFFAGCEEFCRDFSSAFGIALSFLNSFSSRSSSSSSSCSSSSSKVKLLAGFFLARPLRADEGEDLLLLGESEDVEDVS